MRSTRFIPIDMVRRNNGITNARKLVHYHNYSSTSSNPTPSTSGSSIRPFRTVQQHLFRIRQQQQQQQQHQYQLVLGNRIQDDAMFRTKSYSINCRLFSTEDSKKQQDKPVNENKTEELKQEESGNLEDVIRKMKMQGTSSTDDSQKTENNNTNEAIQQVRSIWDKVVTEVTLAWDELKNAGQRKSINKKLVRVNHPEETADGNQPYTGPVDIMIIDPSEKLTAWERMQKRLTDAPIIQDILLKGERLYNDSGAAKVKERIDHVKEDAREAWETSQNPWVYRISSVYDTLTADTPESLALLELRKLDPEFTYDDWRQDVIEHTLPKIMSWFLQGRINQLRPWFHESVFKRLAAEMTAREKEGVQIDTHVLGIMNSEILAVEPDEVNKGSPIIVLHFMCQQINCVRKKSDGTIVEGSEHDIRANSYVAAFQREYDEDKGELNWKIIDFRFNGAIAYL